MLNINIRTYPVRAWLLASLGMLLFAYSLNLLLWRQRGTEGLAADFEQRLHATEQELEEGMQDTVLLNMAILRDISQIRLQEMSQKPYALAIYRHNPGSVAELMTWTNNQVLPLRSALGYEPTYRDTVVQIKGLIFQLKSRPYSLGGLTYTIAGILPLRMKYPVENDYLTETFPLMPNLARYVRVTELNSSTPVYSLHKKLMFRLTSKTLPQLGQWPRWLPLMFWIAGFALFFAAVHKFCARQCAEYQKETQGFFILLIAVLVGRMVLYTDPFAIVRAVEFFKQVGHAQWNLRLSPGDVLLDSAILYWVTSFFNKYVRLSPFLKWPLRKQIFIQIVSYFIPVLMLQLVCEVVKQVAMSQAASLDIADIISANHFSIPALFAFALLVLAHFMSSLKLLGFTARLETPAVWRYLLMALPSLLLVGTHLLGWTSLTSAWVALLGTVHSLVMEGFVKKKQLAAPSWVVLWLVFYAGLLSILIVDWSNEEEARFKLQFAERLAIERDQEAERAFCGIELNLLNDPLLRNYFNPALQGLKDVESRMNTDYFDDVFFTKYDTRFHLYLKNGFPLSGDSLSLLDFESIWSRSEQTCSNYLKFVKNPVGKHSYLAWLPYSDDEGVLQRTLLVEFIPKQRLARNVYVDLLTQREQKVNTRIYDYQFALYKNDRLADHEGGSFPELPNPDFLGGKEQVKTLSFDGRDYLIFRDSTTGNLAVVNSPVKAQLLPLSMFSYILVFLLVVLVAMASVQHWIKLLPAPLNVGLGARSSLRGRIQTAVIGVILLTFAAVAVVTIIYYQKILYEEYHRDRLGRKIASILSYASERLQANPDLLTEPLERDEFVRNMADVQKVVINLYDLEGNLMESSQEEFFDRRITSRQMHPMAYFKIAKNLENQYIQTERAGQYDYQVAYARLMDERRHPMAYISIPYDSQESVLSRHDAVSFLTTLLNVYVLMLLLTALLAVFVSNSITKPLIAISNKLKEVKLGRHNEALNWSADDEIGVLVSRYNEMIDQLEESRQQLVKSEKELAWREMAKQVAHEIKNPLTPMKLNIQLLQRAMESDPERAKEMGRRVTNSLIQQIDTLAEIANEFSNFAKMPTPNNEKVLLNELLSNVLAFFKEEEGEQIRITLEMPAEECYVFADQNQLLRVLNNLVKNAQQAIPLGQKGEIQVLMHCTDNQHVRILVKDNGSGISEDKRSKVFVPYFTTKSSGTGLGLAMSKNIINQAGGEIWFESEEQVGTTFTVELPRMGY